jgi:hypothetical protein
VGSTESLSKALEISLGGLPVPGPGRWVALLVALGLVLGGVVVRGAGSKMAGVRGAHPEEVDAARLLILNELRDLERVRREGTVGPRTYEQARRELVDALARLEPGGALSASAGHAR